MPRLSYVFFFFFALSHYRTWDSKSRTVHMIKFFLSNKNIHSFRSKETENFVQKFSSSPFPPTLFLSLALFPLFLVRILAYNIVYLVAWDYKNRTLINTEICRLRVVICRPREVVEQKNGNTSLEDPLEVNRDGVSLSYHPLSHTFENTFRDKFQEREVTRRFIVVKKNPDNGWIYSWICVRVYLIEKSVFDREALTRVMPRREFGNRIFVITMIQHF